MLRYLANGRLRWKEPLRCNTRTNWEFYAVVEGRCGPVFRDGEPPQLAEKTLWVFAPECSHGWADSGRRSFHRLTFHFGSVPYPLEEIVRAQGWFSRKLSDTEAARIREIAAELEPHFCQPTLISPMVFQARLLDLTALALADYATAPLPTLADLAAFKVERALSWYAEHLSRNPSVKEVADAVHVSTSHLRRLFWQVRHSSTKQAFEKVRFEKAQDLMSCTAHTLEDIARHCGFASASHFIRRYKRTHHFTPTFWRKRLVATFDKPLPRGVVPVREFSARATDRTMSA